LEANDAPLFTCEAVIAESCYLLQHVRGARETILANVKSGIFQLPLPLSKTAGAVLSIFERYRDREIDLADACLIAMADELQIADIMTLDRDFYVYRWGKSKAFRMLIPLP
jgi:predicted nucleic acid-binding protein